MTQELYSVDQVAERLGLHVRTVRSYVRDGRLKAVRIGKQYRISREHLDTLTGHAVEAPDRERETPRRHVEVSSIVQIEAISFEAANRVTSALLASAKGRPETDAALRIDTIHDRERERLKIILTGSLASTATLLKFMTAYLES
jgi:excisionase family DNA binding protein